MELVFNERDFPSLELGDSTILAGTSGVELAHRVLEQAGEPEPVRKASYAYDRSLEYWTGWAIAYYQWDTGLRFSEIEQLCRFPRCECCIRPTMKWTFASLLIR